MSQHNCKLLHDSVTLIWKCYHEERESMKAKLRQNVVACELILVSSTLIKNVEKRSSSWLFSKARNKGYKYEGIIVTFADLDLFWEAIHMVLAGIYAWFGRIQWWTAPLLPYPDFCFLKELFNAFFLHFMPDFNFAFSMYIPCIAIDYLCHYRFRIKASHWLIEVQSLIMKNKDEV